MKETELTLGVSYRTISWVTAWPYQPHGGGQWRFAAQAYNLPVLYGRNCIHYYDVLK